VTGIIDANILVKWFVDEEGADNARQLQDDRLFAPDLIIVEVTNVLWKKVRSDSFAASDVGLAIEVIRMADVILEPGLDLAVRAFEIAHGLNHAVYDCFYLALAERRGLPFVTADDKLSRKVDERPFVTTARIASLSDHVKQRRGVHD